MFISVAGSMDQKPPGEHSIHNNRTLIAGLDALDRLCTSLPKADVLLLAPYAHQIQIYRAIISRFPKFCNVRCMTINSASAIEATYVLFDLVTTGSGGIAKNAQYMNVALSRAKGGLVTIGNRSMIRDHPEKSKGTRAWGRYFKTHTHPPVYESRRVKDQALNDVYQQVLRGFPGVTDNPPQVQSDPVGKDNDGGKEASSAETAQEQNLDLYGTRNNDPAVTANAEIEEEPTSVREGASVAESDLMAFSEKVDEDQPGDGVSMSDLIPFSEQFEEDHISENVSTVASDLMAFSEPPEEDLISFD